jgi:CBS domain-containing protein
MGNETARDLMVPLSDFPQVSEDSELGEAVRVIEEVDRPKGLGRFRHYCVMVTGRDDGKVTGWLGMHDVLMSLDPRYHTKEGLSQISTPGVNRDQLRELVESFGAEQNPLQLVCERACSVHARDIMHSPGDDETIDADAPFDEVVTRLVNEARLIMLVKDGDEPVGVLRLHDVFQQISESMRRCGLALGRIQNSLGRAEDESVPVR